MTVISFEIHKKNFCRHEHYQIDESTGTVECSDCGVRIDPFIALLNMAKGQIRAKYLDEDLMRIKCEIKGAKAELERLKSQARYYKTKSEG